MIEKLRLHGKASLVIDQEPFDAFVTIDLNEPSIEVYGDFDEFYKRTPDVYDFLRNKRISLSGMEFFSNHAKVTGSIDDLVLSWAGDRGFGPTSPSVIARLFNIDTSYHYHRLRLTPKYSMFSFTIDEDVGDCSEVWFRTKSNLLIHREKAEVFGGKVVFLDSDSDFVIVRSVGSALSEEEVRQIQIGLSFVLGSEVYFIYSITRSRFEINLARYVVQSSISVVPTDNRVSALVRFLEYVGTLSGEEFSRFANSILIYLSGKTAPIYMNSRLALYFLCVESLFNGPESVALEQKIRSLFNLDNPKVYDQDLNTISYSLNMATATALARVRNLIAHQGYSAERIYHQEKSDARLAPIIEKCKENCVPLWLFIGSLLDRYFLNRIMYKGEYIDLGDSFTRLRTKI